MDFVSLQNIHNVRASFTLKPHKQVSLALEGHAFWLADTSDNFYTAAGAPRGGVAGTPAGNGYGINPDYDAYVGSEIDIIAGWAMTRYTTLEAGYGHFFTGDYIDSSLSSPLFGSMDADYVYVQLNINF